MMFDKKSIDKYYIYKFISEISILGLINYNKYDLIY